MKRFPGNPHTVKESTSTTLTDGTPITGTLWLHPSRKGSFEVEYRGVRKSDGRIDYTNEAHITSIANMILRELAEDS